MIKVTVTRSRWGSVRTLKVYNHGDPIVCAAVSVLVLSTVNSIEALTDEKFNCNYAEEGGFLEIKFLEETLGRDARLLTDSLMLGLQSISEEYPSNITIEEVAT